MSQSTSVCPVRSLENNVVKILSMWFHYETIEMNNIKTALQP